MMNKEVNESMNEQKGTYNKALLTPKTSAGHWYCEAGSKEFAITFSSQSSLKTGKLCSVI